MAAAMDMTAMNEAAMTNGDPATPDDSGLRVLVADDNALVRESFVQLLESEGFEVRTAVDGEQAVQVADEWQPRVVMLDIHMPGLNGLDAARRLRERHPHEQMTLLMMSGMTLNDAWLRLAKSAGFDDCVDKTSDPQQWLPRLREAPAALRDPA
jgi:CheY-like chemotaxis protein